MRSRAQSTTYLAGSADGGATQPAANLARSPRAGAALTGALVPAPDRAPVPVTPPPGVRAEPAGLLVEQPASKNGRARTGEARRDQRRGIVAATKAEERRRSRTFPDMSDDQGLR
ncbi:MAG: hypothetical protein MJD61_09000 [Proteobacteria bacterium]|nr:hypothetical protein [Pseudomonadota bacterium]